MEKDLSPGQYRDLAEFRTVDTCVKTEVNAAATRTAPITPGRTGYLGVSTKKNDAGRLVVDEVAADSPAEKAGLIVGDEVLTVGGVAVESPAALRDLLQGFEPGKNVTIAIRCGEHERRLSAQLEATSKELPFHGVYRIGRFYAIGPPSDAVTEIRMTATYESAGRLRGLQ
jgi:predicted metalloprotease with PDZ domain